MSTIRDVARLAGVSISSVSRYFNNKELLSDESRLRIEKAVEELNYYPSSLGRNLRFSRSGKLLALLPTISNPFYHRILSAISKECEQYGYTMITCTTGLNKYTEQTLYEMLHSHYADGAIIFGSALNKNELEALFRKYPIVQCCEYIDACLPSVTIDNELASYEAVKYLISSGCCNIAMASGNPRFSSTLSREAGYKRALNSAGLRFSPDLLVRGDYGYNGGQSIVKKLFSRPGKKPDALFAISDAVAIGAIKELHDMGIEAGKTFSVIGFDNTSLSSCYIPSLSTVSQPREDLGRTAARLFFERLENSKAAPRLITLEHKLIIRESTINIMR